MEVSPTDDRAAVSGMTAVRSSRQCRADMTARLLADVSAVTTPAPAPEGWPEIFAFAEQHHAAQAAERAQAGRLASRPSANPFDAGCRGTTVPAPPPDMEQQLRAAADRARFRSDRASLFMDGTLAAVEQGGSRQAAEAALDDG